MDKINITKIRTYRMTITIIIITSLITIAQFIYPPVLSMLRRNPEELLSGQWWRLVTPLLVHSEGLSQFIVNIIGILTFGLITEKLFGSSKLITLYLAGGLAGEIVGYIGWDPFGAGASVGWCGILGGLIYMIIKIKNATLPKSVFILALYYIVGLIISVLKNYVIGILAFVITMGLQSLSLRQQNRKANIILGIYGILGAIILIFLHDIHGVAIISGFCTALVMHAHS